MKEATEFSSEVRESAMRMVFGGVPSTARTGQQSKPLSPGSITRPICSATGYDGLNVIPGSAIGATQPRHGTSAMPAGSSAWGPSWHWPPCCAWAGAAPGYPGPPPWAWYCPSACWHTTTAAHCGCGPCGRWWRSPQPAGYATGMR